MTTETAPKLPTPTRMLVTDRRLAGGERALVRAVESAVDGGVNVVQLREKDLSPAELLPLARQLREGTAGRALLIVNGPLDVALEVRADGVHLPEDAVMVQRPAAGFIVGRSVHSLDAARKATVEGVDYLVAGPVYATASHPGSPVAGAVLIRQISATVMVPVIAIGGLTAGNAADVVSAGASGVAVISAVLSRRDARGAAADLRSALDAARVWAGVRR